MAEDDLYTQDGTVDFHGNPAKKNETGSWKACLFILVNKSFESLAYYGMSTNLVVYFMERLGQHTYTASNNVTNWSGTCSITPFIGGFVADAYLGRYWTIAIFSVIYTLGMLLLALSASVEGLKPICDLNNSSCHATAAQTAVFFIALYLIAVGTGGIKPCVSSFGADQFDDSDGTEKKNKSSYFSWLYFSANIGGIIAASVLVWIQTNINWQWGFGIPALALGIAVVFFFGGTGFYRNQKPGGSPLTRICQVFVAAFRKYKVDVPIDVKLLYETDDSESAVRGSRKLRHTTDFLFLDKAAVETAADTSTNPWRLCTVTQVEELKSVIRLLPIWITCIVFATVYAQSSTLFVLQGLKMGARVGNSKFEVPAASMFIFNSLSVLISVPLYDKLIIPVFKKLTHQENGFTPLQRMGIGLFISIFGILSAGILEAVRLEYSKHKRSISIFWQVPQYSIIGCAEVFTVVGQTELLYEQAPDGMRALCSALLPMTLALGNYLSTALVTVVSRVTSRGGRMGWIPDDFNLGHLHYFFYLLVGMSVLNLFGFVLLARWYTYKLVVS